MMRFGIATDDVLSPFVASQGATAIAGRGPRPSRRRQSSHCTKCQRAPATKTCVPAMHCRSLASLTCVVVVVVRSTLGCVSVCTSARVPKLRHSISAHRRPSRGWTTACWTRCLRSARASRRIALIASHYLLLTAAVGFFLRVFLLGCDATTTQLLCRVGPQRTHVGQRPRERRVCVDTVLLGSVFSPTCVFCFF